MPAHAANINRTEEAIRVPGLAVAAVAAWVLYVVGLAAYLGPDPRATAPYLYAPALVALGCLLGWRLANRAPTRSVAVVLVVVAAWMLAGVLLTALPGKMPIGYANANAALAVQLLALAGLTALHRRARLRSWLAIALGLITVLANRSAAGIATVALPILASLYAVRATPGKRRWPVAALSITSLLGTSLVLVVLSRRAAWPPAAIAAFDEVRRQLWLQSWEAFRQAETFGRGPGGFESINVYTDPDLASAHSLPLQVAVELGGVGLVLLVLLFVAGLATALRAATPAQSWITVAAWTALAVHSFVDHLLEYWPIPLAAGLVLGYGLVAKPEPEPEDEIV